MNCYQNIIININSKGVRGNLSDHSKYSKEFMLQILKFGNSILKKENSQSMHMNKQYAPYALIGKQVHAWHSGCPNLSGNSPFIRAVAIAWYSIQSKTYQISILFNYVRSNRKVSTTWHGGSLNIIWRHINKIIFKNRWNQLKEIDCLTEHVSVEREKNDLHNAK